MFNSTIWYVVLLVLSCFFLCGNPSTYGIWLLVFALRLLVVCWMMGNGGADPDVGKGKSGSVSLWAQI
ncbi:MAG TPA: hypothetical protein DEG17_20190 [Cyanobacteria bacterium UBA11149]|nr:hypothetical protein [Cyanobacteria bacterium UBA11367]HBE58333.1 hypothetical protein [Cyanobacteria bacterium UBA11366]HBR77041.1 hypothetical protein [Cyanobacteria bacterium UBA11159]HBS70150.1 hypothetical protein [Cyanobacteria bacterium UBA11153]HBW91118.1 hypothetical protein [Cyanobacteria bacterium UBA11149]HCA95969.1 hypothetical protein [Cyanobacteria bacterium UBA9226]